MTPFQLERRVLSYLEDFDNIPLIHRIINEAIQRICVANLPGQDWAFLSFTETVALNPTTGIGTLTHYPRVVIDTTPIDNYTIDFAAKTITYAGTAAPKPTTVSVKYYRRHPFISTDNLTESDSAPYDTTWTAANPVTTKLIIPPEHHELIVYAALDLLYEHEIEVAINRQTAVERLKDGIASMRANYSFSVYPALQPATVTADYLVTHACLKSNGERGRAKWLNTLNTIATELADAVKLSLTDRTAIVLVTNYTDALPQIKGKAVPADVWYKAMMFYVGMSGMADAKDIQVVTAQYQAALSNFKDMFYGVTVSTSYNLSTYGAVVEYLRSIWKTYRSEHQLWAVVNDAVGEVLNKIDVEDLATSYDVVATGASSYTMPTKCKRIYKVTIDGMQIPGKASHDNDLQYYRHAGGASYESDEQSFYFQGRTITFKSAPSTGAALKFHYYQKQVFNADPAIAFPIDALIVLPYMEAYVALQSKDFSTYKALSAKFMEKLGDFSESQDNAAPMDLHMDSSTQTVDSLVANHG